MLKTIDSSDGSDGLSNIPKMHGPVFESAIFMNEFSYLKRKNQRA